MYVMRKPRSGSTTTSAPYFDPRHNAKVLKVLPGEYVATGDDCILSTLLGSCVSACIRDPQAGVGGMNHFMLPDESGAAGESARYGGYAMEMLINELLKLGADRHRLEAKVFGGGAVLPSLTVSRVGERNAEFVLDYLKREQIPVVSQDLLDTCPRQVHFFPQSGKVMLRKLPTVDRSLVAADETRYRSRLRREPVEGSVELFE
ncbi:MAG TPA: chemoreceptor glutamine deamidase CheD [Solimonas sp.]|nr:chemoreceptor glutamine deamidase CheD [Solimonas sp.]